MMNFFLVPPTSEDITQNFPHIKVTSVASYSLAVDSLALVGILDVEMCPIKKIIWSDDTKI